jgi:hypothetical protein
MNMCQSEKNLEHFFPWEDKNEREKKKQNTPYIHNLTLYPNLGLLWVLVGPK